LKNGIEVEEVNNILEKMTELTADNQGDLRSGDLEVSSSTLNNVADHASERTNSIFTNQLEVSIKGRHYVKDLPNVT
jgi:hypothetical protein